MGAQVTATAARPLIGISASEVRAAKTIRRVREDEPPSHEIALGVSYVAAIAAAGGMPLVIPPLEPDLIDELLDQRLDGVCLSGGPDLDPSFYGAEPDPNLGPTDPDFDAFELALAAGAVERGMPILAICRGAQVLNVSLGGSLIQHLPDHTSLAHRQEAPGDVPGHPVSLSRESRLADLIEQSEIAVNTYHHQAVRELGQGLAVAARAPDRVVEAIEVEDLPFAIGVQWHAELMAPRQIEARLFEGLVGAAAERADSPQRPAERTQR